MSEGTSTSLLLATHRGDRHAAMTLYAAHAPRLTALARALMRGEASAEDVVQQVFVRILTLGEDELALVRDVPAWLTTLTRHTALNAVRGNTRSELRERVRAVRARDRGGERSVEGVEPGLRAAIDLLPDEHRELVLLKHVGGLTLEQIAVSLDENRNTVAARYRAAIGFLRDRLAEEQPPAQSASPSTPRATVNHE